MNKKMEEKDSKEYVLMDTVLNMTYGDSPVCLANETVSALNYAYALNGSDLRYVEVSTSKKKRK